MEGGGRREEVGLMMVIRQGAKRKDIEWCADHAMAPQGRRIGERSEMS
jgi:hypothetical protein